MSEQIEAVKIKVKSHAELKAEVKKLIGNPLSVWAVAATLESLGVREIDARREFGFDSIFDLADQIYHELKREFREEGHSGILYNEKLNVDGPWSQITYFLTYYFQGLLFSLPLISQILALFIFRYSLWAWLEFNEAQATLVAFGTITAFVVTGGFIQVLGHSISSYISTDNYFLAFESSKKIVKAGVIAISAVCLIIMITNLIIPFYPWPMVVLAVIYTLLISLLLLTSGVLFALKRRLSILVIIVAGTILVIVNREIFHLSIYLSQWLAMSVTSLLLAGYSWLYFRRTIRKKEEDPASQSLPDIEVRNFINYRYFIYGTGYFLFIFMDRLLAWSTGEPPPPFILWFNTPYEIGMDWALITLILSFAMLEYSVNIFSRALKPLQENVWFRELDRFNTYFKRLYFKQLLLIIVTGLISIAVTYYAVSSLIVYQDTIPEV